MLTQSLYCKARLKTLQCYRWLRYSAQVKKLMLTHSVYFPVFQPTGLPSSPLTPGCTGFLTSDPCLSLNQMSDSHSCKDELYQLLQMSAGPHFACCVSAHSGLYGTEVCLNNFRSSCLVAVWLQAFGTIGPVETAYFRETGKQLLLSEQDLMDCGWYQNNKACFGGYQVRPPPSTLPPPPPLHPPLTIPFSLLGSYPSLPPSPPAHIPLHISILCLPIISLPALNRSLTIYPSSSAVCSSKNPPPPLPLPLLIYTSTVVGRSPGFAWLMWPRYHCSNNLELLLALVASILQLTA